MSNNLPVPITREERYLAYIAGRKDVEIPKKPITRKEKYLDRWAFNRDIKVVEVTGNPVQCTPIPGSSMKVTASWKPKQDGSGTPSPENIRPITGRDSVMVERCGKNLLNITKFNKVTKKGMDFEYLADGGIHIVGTATAAVDSPIFTIPFLPSGKYYGLDLGVDIFASIVVIRNGNKSWLNTKGVFEILTGDITQYWYIYIEKGNTVDRILYPYIVAGTVAPTDEKNPYEMQANTLTLTETIYGGSVDAATGEGEKQYGFYTLTGREPHHIYEGMFYLDVPKAKANGQRESGICSHYNYGVYIPGKIGVTDRPVYTPNGDYTPDNDGAIAWKAYLAAQYAAGTPVQIAYKLAEPVPFKATGGQPIKALKGINTVFTDADSVSVKYKKMREV